MFIKFNHYKTLCISVKQNEMIGMRIREKLKLNEKAIQKMYATIQGKNINLKKNFQENLVKDKDTIHLNLRLIGGCSRTK